MKRLPKFRSVHSLFAVSLLALSACSLLRDSAANLPPGTTNDPYPDPFSEDDIIAVNYRDFVSLPDTPRLMALTDEPGTRRLFITAMTGEMWTTDYDGRYTHLYVNIDAPDYRVQVQSEGTERGFQAMAFHPDFAKEGAPGYGKFYTLVDTTNTDPQPTFLPLTEENTHDSVLLEWTAKDANSPAYDGDAPRELIRWAQPYANHNCGHIAFNPTAEPGDEDYGLLYVGFADGGAYADLHGHAQNLGVAFGKILRIDPLGSDGGNGQYGIPASNPFANDGDDHTLGEIYAYGVRNPQRLFWDPANGNMYMSDIGQDAVEEVSPVTKGANLGWNLWEGSFRFIPPNAVRLEDKRGDPNVTFPVAEYDQQDERLQSGSAVIGGLIYRGDEIPDLNGKLLFADNPSGLIWYVDMDDLPVGQNGLHFVKFRQGSKEVPLLDLIHEKNREQGHGEVQRAEMRFGEDHNGRIYILNRGDGVVRLVTP